VIVKAKSHQRTPIPLLKQKSGISQAKDNYPEKSGTAQYGKLQRLIADMIGPILLPNGAIPCLKFIASARAFPARDLSSSSRSSTEWHPI
jgi:hypothetical protein